MPDLYQSFANILDGIRQDPMCAISPLHMLIQNSRCINTPMSQQMPPPIIVTPAAPRSLAEMRSGMWTPDEAARFTWEKYTTAKTNQEKQMLAGNNYATLPTGENEEDLSSLWVLGGMILAGLIIVRGIVK